GRFGVGRAFRGRHAGFGNKAEVCTRRFGKLAAESLEDAGTDAVLPPVNTLQERAIVRRPRAAVAELMRVIEQPEKLGCVVDAVNPKFQRVDFPGAERNVWTTARCECPRTAEGEIRLV